MSSVGSSGRDETATASTSGRDDRAEAANKTQDSQLHSLFDELDADHSGKIEPAELRVRPSHTLLSENALQGECRSKKSA